VFGRGSGRILEVTIANDLDAPIVVPSCGNLLAQYIVCFPPAFFEQYDGSVWKRVKDKGDHLYGELASPPVVRIEPGKSIEIRAPFPPGTYKWEAGQLVRLIIPIWPASDANRTSKNRILYMTGPLQAPDSGRMSFLPQ
jgi:hypothetical protein